VLVLTSLAGCEEEAAPTSPVATASDPTPSEPDTADPSERSEPSATAAPLPDSLDFTATTVEGDRFEGGSLAGKPVLLWFWAPWCPTCLSQVPHVESLAETYAGDVAVIGVGSLDSAEAIADFAADVDGVTHLEDVDGVLYRKFGIAEQSSFVLLDADGEVSFETGYGGSEDLAGEVAAVADAAGSAG
jgi:thiol-disulfide isomerase/thioredoxin